MTNLEQDLIKLKEKLERKISSLNKKFGELSIKVENIPSHIEIYCYIDVMSEIDSILKNHGVIK